MQPRGKLDIGRKDLGFGFAACFRHDDPETIRTRLERSWSTEGTAFACLSVRTGFAALLEALALPPGSEILVSALTIRDMTQIIEAHKLVAVPVDLDMETLSVPLARLESLVGGQTRAILIAHVWGSRMPLDEIAAFADARHLILIEDCAQAFTGDDWRGHPGADASMFSFGPIKTSTALGGAMLTIRNRVLYERIRAIESTYPEQEKSRHLRRLVKYAGLKALSHPRTFGCFVAVCRLTGRSHDAVISHALRGFPGPELIRNIRRRPCAPLLALMERRLGQNTARRVERRVSVAQEAIGMLPGIRMPGLLAPHHSWWVFPIRSDDPDRLMQQLWKRGFDATRGASSLAPVDPPEGRPETEPAESREWMRRLLYLPVSGGTHRKTLSELMSDVRALERASAEESATEPDSRLVEACESS